MELWERGWKHVFDALEPPNDEDLVRTIPIRNRAALRDAGHQSQVAHYRIIWDRLYRCLASCDQSGGVGNHCACRVANQRSSP